MTRRGRQDSQRTIGFLGRMGGAISGYRPSRPSPDHPQFLHRPHYEIPRSYGGLQNTDPFVFGAQFHYTGCLQNTRKGPTQLRNLMVGTVILFGAGKDGRFLLDTVFVVKRFVDHDRSSYERALRGKVSDVYWDVTVQPWYFGRTCGPGESYRLYYGATYDDPQNDMYSFVPAGPLNSQQGFARPAIAIDGVINGAQTQGKTLNPQASTARVRSLWEEVARQVKATGLDLGVSIRLPPRLARNP